MAKKVKEDFTADFFPALEELEKVNKISKESMIEALESGLVSAYKKEFGEARTIAVRLNEEKGTIKVYAHRLIVEEVEDEASQISLEDALEIKENAQIGEVIVEDITPKDFSRIAAQTARQVVIQRINDAKKEYILKVLAMEEDRFFDLVRTGKTDKLKGFVKGKHEVFPIPAQQRQLNSNLNQNNGY